MLGLIVGLSLYFNAALFASSPGYAFMARMADERTWGRVILAVFALRFTALTANGTFDGFRRFSPMVRSLCAGIQAGVWFTIAAGVYVSAPYALLWRLCAGLFVFEIALSLMIAKPAGQAFEHGR